MFPLSFKVINIKYRAEETVITTKSLVSVYWTGKSKSCVVCVG